MILGHSADSIERAWTFHMELGRVQHLIRFR